MNRTALAAALVLAAPLAARPAAGQVVEPITPDPVQATVQFEIPDGFSGVCTDLYVVPPRRSLVIEYASAFVQMPFTEAAKSIQLRTWLDGERVDHHLDLEVTGSGNDSRAAHPVRLYADGDTGVSVCAYRANAVGISRVRVSFAGHLE
jgi:hypothetical protein